MVIDHTESAIFLFLMILNFDNVSRSLLVVRCKNNNEILWDTMVRLGQVLKIFVFIN